MFKIKIFETVKKALSYLTAVNPIEVREGVKKKLLKSGQAFKPILPIFADRLGGGHPPLQPDRFYFVKILTHFVLYKMAAF